MNLQEWRNIPGYNGTYQANFDGQIRRVFKNGKYRILAQYPKTHTKKVFCKINCKETNAAKIIWIAFNGSIPDGMNVIHKNGMQTDNCINNLSLVTKKELGNVYGKLSNQKCVAKIDSSGQIVEFYQSARECGRKNYLSRQTVTDRCNGKCKSPYAPDGYAYAWEDSEISMKHAIRKIEEDNGFMPKARKVVFDF